MPQIAQIAATYASQIFWMLIVFALIYFGIGKGMLPKIDATVDARDKRIADDLAAAHKARAEADTTEADYTARMEKARGEALAATAEAKRSSAAAAEARIKAADANLAAKGAEAEARLAEQQRAALAGLETVAAEAAQEIVARVSTVSIDRGEAERAVKAVLAHA